MFKRLWHRSYTVQGGPASSAVCVHVSSRHAHVAAALSILCAPSSICRGGSLERERDAGSATPP